MTTAKRGLTLTHEEFAAWLEEEVNGDRMTPAQQQDLLHQKSLFDGRRTVIQLEYLGQIVGYVAGQLRAAPKINELLETSNTQFPGSMVYFEPVGFDLI
jgi:hypothetical protein